MSYALLIESIAKMTLQDPLGIKELQIDLYFKEFSRNSPFALLMFYFPIKRGFKIAREILAGSMKSDNFGAVEVKY